MGGEPPAPGHETSSRIRTNREPGRRGELAYGSATRSRVSSFNVSVCRFPIANDLPSAPGDRSRIRRMLCRNEFLPRRRGAGEGSFFFGRPGRARGRLPLTSPGSPDALRSGAASGPAHAPICLDTCERVAQPHASSPRLPASLLHLIRAHRVWHFHGSVWPSRAPATVDRQEPMAAVRLAALRAGIRRRCVCSARRCV
jgi:hypothetical protein